MLVKVRKIKADPWSNLRKYDGCTTKISVGLDAVTGEVKTGLTKVEEEMWEDKLGYSKGTLAKSSEFWKDFFIPIGLELKLDTDLPQHAFYLHVLNQKKNIAKSIDDIKKNSSAEFVIFSEELEAKEENKKRKLKKEAYAKLNSMSPEDLRTFLIAAGFKPYSMNPEVLEDTVGRMAEENPSVFLTIANDEHIAEKVFLNNLVHVGVLTTKGGNYFYEKTLLGDPANAVLWLHNKSNSELVATLKLQLKAKLK
jgi:hypothetical protein